jgi:hypothetical protein
MISENRPRHIVGAYAASPAEADQDEWFEALAGLPGFAGLEMAYQDGLRPHGDEAVLSRLRPEWDLVLTGVPCSASRSRVDGAYGIASPVADGRSAAIADIRAMFECAQRIHDRVGRGAVVAVEVQSAPNRAIGTGTAEALAASLSEIATWEWGSTRIVVEHCDAFVPSHPSEKGFLSLDDELDAVRRASQSSGAVIGVSVNWGRSALEGRSAETPADHVAEAAAAGLLAGLVFSGVSDRDTAYGRAWSDTHLPPDTIEPGSLLTEHAVASCLKAAESSDLAFCGIKMCAKPDDATVADRIAILGEALAMLDRARG